MDYVYADVVVTDLAVKVFCISIMEEVLPHGKGRKCIDRLKKSPCLAVTVSVISSDFLHSIKNL
jgi:hypothetical protein